MLKKTTLAVLGLAINGFAFAGSMGPVCTPGSVTVGCEVNQWSFGVDALYLKAVNSDPMAFRNNLFGGLTELNNQWNWGFRAAAAYQYNTGNDVNISWLHYNNSESLNNLAGAFLNLAPPPVVPFVTLPYTLVAQNRIDQVNVVAGQQISAGIIDKMRFYAGIQYAEIQQNMINYFSPGSYFDNNDYKGAGPVVGIDYSYDVSPQISVVASGSTSLLYGIRRMNTGFIVTPVAPFNVVPLARYERREAVVPGFDAKLGLNYAYAMPQGMINLQGGYQVTDYFHALQSSGSAIPTTPIRSVDYALYGPYIGLKYVGNA